MSEPLSTGEPGARPAPHGLSRLRQYVTLHADEGLCNCFIEIAAGSRFVCVQCIRGFPCDVRITPRGGSLSQNGLPSVVRLTATRRTLWRASIAQQHYSASEGERV